MRTFYFYIFVLLLIACDHTGSGKQVKYAGSVADKTIDSLISLSNKTFDNSNDNKIMDNNILQALDIAQKNERQRKEFNINLILSKRYFHIARYSKAIIYANKALTIAKNLDDDLLKAEAIQEMAVNFRRLNDNSHALKLHTTALELAENVKDTFLIHCSYNGIGDVYFQYKDYPRAVKYFHKSLNFLGKDPVNILGDAINSNLLGEAWLYLGNTDSAMYYLIRSYEANTKLGSEQGKGICYNGFGLVYQKKKHYRKAISAFNKSIKYFKQPGDVYYISMAHYNLGKTYKEMGQLKNAVYHLNKASELSDSIGNKYFAVNALTQLAHLYKELGYTDKAFESGMKALAYKDSITKEMQVQDIDAMQTLYKSEKQEREILILKQKNELAELKFARQKLITAVIVSLGIILLLLGIFIYRQRLLNAKLNEIGLKQRLLRAQMNPHFIFNSLGSIQNFMYNNETKKAAFYLGSFSSLMRSILENSRKELISIEEETETLNNYLELQKMRLGFSYEIVCSEDIDKEFVLIPPMLIQPFVENSIKHGIKDMGENGHIKVEFLLNRDRLKVTVEDNGVGINHGSTPDKDHKSLAMKIFKERISFLSSYLKKEIIYQIFDKSETNNHERGTIVIVELPMIK